MLHRVEEVLDLPVPLAELPQQADEWQKLVDEMAAEDDEVTEYIRNLEQRDDEIDRGAMRETSGDAIAREFERYLRRRDRGGGHGGHGAGRLIGSHQPGYRADVFELVLLARHGETEWNRQATQARPA